MRRITLYCLGLSAYEKIELNIQSGNNLDEFNKILNSFKFIENFKVYRLIL